MSGALIDPPLMRLATRDDLSRIVELLANDDLGATREQASDPLPPAYEIAFDAITAQQGNAIIVAELDGTVVGCLQLTFIPGLSRLGATRALIEGVRVATTHRGHRIGEALIRDAIERARVAGCTLVQLTSDVRRKEAHRFYERLGFAATHIGYKMELRTGERP